MTEPLNFFEHCEKCGLIWDATICADNPTNCPYCAYIYTSDYLYDANQEITELEQARDEAQSEAGEHAFDLEQLQHEHEELHGRYEDAEDELNDARTRIAELEREALFHE